MTDGAHSLGENRAQNGAATPSLLEKRSFRRLFYAGSLSIIVSLALALSILYTYQSMTDAERRIQQYSNALVAEKKHFLRNAVERTFSLIEHERAQTAAELAGSEASSGEIEEKAKERIRNLIRNIKLIDNGYIWVNHILDYNGGDGYAVRAVHPNLPDTEGMALSTNMTDIKGNRPYEAELEGVKKDGELFFEYYFKKPDSDEIAHKMSFAKLYKPYDWVVATGVYLDDVDRLIQIETQKIQAANRSQLLSTFFISALFVLVTLLVIVRFERHFIRLISDHEAIIGDNVALREKLTEALASLIVMQDKDHKELVDFVLQAGVEISGSRIGFVGFVNPEQTIMHTHAWSRNVYKSCLVEDQKLDFDVASGGLWAEVIRRKAPVICNYLSEEPRSRGTPEGHVTVNRYLGCPVIEGDKVVFVCGVGNKEEAYADNEVHLLSTFVNAAWQIIKRREAEAAVKSAEEQLHQAEKLKAVGQLTGGIAHDFNNLLQVIETNLDLARELVRNTSPDAAEMIEAALNSERRGAELTQKLLAFSRKQTLRPHRVSLNDWLPGEVRLLSRTLGEDIEIRTEPTTDEVLVDVDEGTLTNALLNIAINARAAMPFGGTLTLSTSRHHFAEGIPIENDSLPSGDYVELAVSDTGIGMSDETLQRAFEPFFTTKDVGEGSGLGLSMVYGFARQSGGTVTIESELDKATTVRILLPAATEEATEAGSNRHEGSAANHTTKVLLVEDDTEVRKSTVLLLKSVGCEVIETDKAAPVYDILNKNDGINLLITDVVLPGGVNGVEVARQAVALRPDLKVILVSGYPDAILAKSGLSEANYLLLPKPFSRTALSEAIATVMGEKV